MPNSKKSTGTQTKTTKKVALEAASKQQKEALGAELAEFIIGAYADSINKGDPLQGLPALTEQLKQKQDELDIMASDSLPSAILSDYFSDILLPNSNGDLVSIVAKDMNHQSVLDGIFERLAFQNQEEKIIYSLLKNGIVIGEFEQFNQKSVAAQAATQAANESASGEQVYVRSPGTILPNLSIINDTYTVFPLVKYGRCIGYLEVKKEKSFFETYNWQTDRINYKDVVIHPATDYAYVTFGTRKSSKPLQIALENDDGVIQVYDVDTGCSMLENAYSAWKTLSLLEDSIVLASLIKNAQIMLVEVEGGTATKQQIEAAKIKLRSLFEGQLSIGRNGMKQYLNPQSKPAYIYNFTSKGIGKITAQIIGGEYNPGQLYYLNPFVNQFFSAMSAPKQNYGFGGGEGAGMDAGGAVEQYNIRYKSTVSRVKRLYGLFIKKCINNVLVSKGLTNLVDNFIVKVYGAYDEVTNNEMQSQQTKLSLYQSVLEFTGVEDPEKQRKLRSLLLKQVITDPTVTSAIDEIMFKDAKEKEDEKNKTEGGEDTGLDTQLSEGAEDQLGGDLGLDLGEEPAEGGETPTETELPEMSETLGEGENNE